ncbi:MAG TPA: substrate-binding domain-containing protein [Candidatus Solibacter sp.]|jgi:ABC-type phosphate transport system substrate-binding protein|nr:substrate-binding domain-containing protein [Candidatus Solibacter sp.]
MKRFRTLFGAGLVSAISIFGISATTALAGPNGTGGGPTAEKIIGSGSDTTQIMMMHLDGLYMISEGCAKSTSSVKPLDFSCISPDPAGTIVSENYEHDQVQEADFLGSSTGIAQLCSQGTAGTANIDYARSSRGKKSSDCTGLHFVAYARDGIAVESFNDGTAASGIFGLNNPDTLCPANTWCLTQTQLKAIYGSCTITNWSQVGGQNQVIQIFTPQSGSGTRSQFETFLGITDSSVCITTDGQPASQANVPENQNTGIENTGFQKTFIFPFSFAIFKTEINNTAVPGYLLASIDGVTASPATIGCEAGPPTCTAFPYSRYVYNVFCSTNTAGTCGAGASHMVTTKTADYVGEEGWICKPGSNENAGWVGNGNVPALDTSNPNAQAPHGASPHFLNNWATIIATKIRSRGFAPLAIATIGSGDLNQDHCRLITTP